MKYTALQLNSFPSVDVTHDLIGVWGQSM